MGDYIYEKRRYGFFWVHTGFTSAMFLAFRCCMGEFADCLHYADDRAGSFPVAFLVCLYMLFFAVIRCIMVLNKKSRKITFRKKSN